MRRLSQTAACLGTLNCARVCSLQYVALPPGGQVRLRPNVPSWPAVLLLLAVMAVLPVAALAMLKKGR